MPWPRTWSRQSARCRCHLGSKFHFTVASGNDYGLARRDFTTQQFHRQRILNQRLNGPLQWSRAEIWIVTFARQELPGRLFQHQRHVSFMQHRSQSLKLKVDDLSNLVSRQTVKDHNVVDAIQKLGLEVIAKYLRHRFPYLLFIFADVLDLARAEIRSHD